MNVLRTARLACVVALVTVGCSRGDPDKDAIRGPGLRAARLSADSRARAYEAAVRTAFDLDDPAVSVLMDSRLLPRSAALDSAGTVPDSVVHLMTRRGVVRGTCRPPLAKQSTPKCEAALPGYIVRFSDVLTVAGDTAEVYLWAQKYDNAASGFSRPLRFERAYQIVRSGSGWRAEQEARIAEP